MVGSFDEEMKHNDASMVQARVGVASLVNLHNVHHVCPRLGRRLAVDSRLAAHLQRLAPELGDLVHGVPATLAATRLAARSGHVARAPLTAARQLARVQARRATPTAPACCRHWLLVVQNSRWRLRRRSRITAALRRRRRIRTGSADLQHCGYLYELVRRRGGTIVR